MDKDLIVLKPAVEDPNWTPEQRKESPVVAY